MYHLLKFGILFVTPLATISIPYLSREISKDNSKVTETNRNSSVNLDGSIILINENKLDFGSPRELFLNDVALKNKQQKSFNNSEELLNYLLGITKALNTENWQISLPKKVFQTLSDGFTLEPLDSTQHKQRIIFQKDQESSELHSALFQPLWKKWISNWNSKSVGIKKIIFGISADNNLLGKSYEIEQLHKCHNGNRYSIRFNSKLSSQDIEDVDFKHWLNNHLGIL